MSEPLSNRGPNIRIPPPLFYVVAFVIAWLLDRRLEFDIARDGPGAMQEAIGLGAAALGLALMFWAISTFVWHRTAVIPNRPARQVVTTGPYRFTRNPMYVGLTLLYVGLAILLNMAWPLVLLPLVLAAIRALVVSKEEAYLRAAFADEYAAYCRNVRRWL